MIGALLALSALAGTPPQPPPQEDPSVKCAFEKARQLAAASSETPDSVADEVVGTCAPAGNGDASAEFTRFRVRAAAVAMVNRQRGLDGQPADAPFRLPAARVSLPLGRFEIPDAIAPAVVPYFECLLGSTGVSVRDGGREMPPAAARGADCSAQRSLAATRADDMLRQAGGKSRVERRALIDATLASAEDFAAKSAPSPDPRKASDAPN
jgi:hypothetical protein